MPKPLNVVFVWHFHQPSYLDYATGVYRMPWVRLHAIKDYYGFALLLSRFPEIKVTFNVTPVLAGQIKDIVERRASDEFLELSLRPADTLNAAERFFVLRNFFSLNWETMLPAFPRYQQLLSKRGRSASDREIEERAADFSVPELRDLQVLFNLAWFHPLLRQEDGRLKELVRKGRYYTEDEKKAVIDFQYEIMSRVIPFWKEMAESGRIEISTSPFYHPILPLLLSGPEPLPEDAELQVRMARQFHREVFGNDAAGCWPSEGAVSDETLRLLIRQGFSWTATDEGILSRSWGGGAFDRRNIYRPYSYHDGDGKISLVFRDRHISDKISFTYRFRAARAGADDFFSDLFRIRNTLSEGEGGVSIILDGENAWEYYPEGGVPFLTNLYASLAEQKEFRTVTVSRFLSETQPAPLEHIHAGSWINQDFHIWSGYPAADIAWEAVRKARAGRKMEEISEPAARNSLLAAEGSDWFWWFSPEHSSGRDEEFDGLFRLMLLNFYRLQGEKEPDDLYRPVKTAREEVLFPKNSITPRIDGKITSYYEWLGAGSFIQAAFSGTMHPACTIVRDLLFGWDRDNLYLRLDLDPVCVEEDGFVFCLDFGRAGQWSFEAKSGKIIPKSYSFAVVQDVVVEVSFPWKNLGLQSGAETAFHFEIRRDGHLIARYPRQEELKISLPREDYESDFWL